MKWDREDTGFAAILGVLALATLIPIVALMIPLVKHWGHPGHHERRWVAGQTVVQPVITTGPNGQMSSGVTTQYVPEHEERVWVCDICK